MKMTCLILAFWVANSCFIASMAFAADRQLCVGADERVELLATVQLLADYFLVSKYPSDYKKEVVQHFQTYKNHAAVRYFRELSANDFAYSEPFKYVLEHGSLPDFMPNQYNAEFKPSSVMQADSLLLLSIYLKDFYEKTNFRAFFDEHSYLYDTLTTAIVESLGKTDYVALLEAYYGMPQADYEIIFSPLLPNGGFGPAVVLPNQRYHLYALVGPNGVEDGLPTFDTDFLTKSLLLHEFSHSFINPLTEKYWNELKQYDTLYSFIAADMEARAYTSWDIAINEHLVRAIVIRLVQQEQGRQAADRLLEREKKAGFYYIEPLLHALAKYENKRKKYSTFESFYPEIVRVWQELSNNLVSR